LFGIFPGAALEHVGHHRGRRLADGAALALDFDVGDTAILAQLQINGDAVAGERVVAFRLVAGVSHGAVMARMARMVENDLLIQFPERVIHGRISRGPWPGPQSASRHRRACCKARSWPGWWTPRRTAPS